MTGSTRRNLLAIAAALAGTVQLAAAANGTSSGAVSWSIAEGSSGGSTISGAGLYTAPSAAGAYHVVATSQADPTVSGRATVTVTAPSPPPPSTGSGLFVAANPWNTAVDTAPLSAASGTVISALSSAGGWGFGRMQIDFSMNVLSANASTPFVSLKPDSGYYSPDCDTGITFPLPANGAIEGESGYTCSSGGDCHLLVVDSAHQRLYETYQANVAGGVLQSMCTVVWDLTKSYPADLRGDQCTSTDAAGLPVAALLFTADEIAAGSIDHAIRFILPNARMAAGVYVRPATHAGAPSGASNLPPYGSRFRLKASYNLASLPSDGARVVARALQKYGMILADGGNVALTAANDAYTQHKWANVGLDALSLSGLKVTDFEVVDGGPTIARTNDCVRNGQ